VAYLEQVTVILDWDEWLKLEVRGDVTFPGVPGKWRMGAVTNIGNQVRVLGTNPDHPSPKALDRR